MAVCAKWSQAENISTEEHKAVTCHRAALLGFQSCRAVFKKLLEDHDETLTADLTGPLVFIEARTSEPFIYRKHKVVRTG